MNRKKRLTALLLAGLLPVCAVAGCKHTEKPIHIKKELAPLCGTQDDFLEYNPDRGWRLEAFINVANLSLIHI